MDSDTDVESDSVVEPSFASRLFQLGNDRLGYILFLSSLILWAEGKSSLSKCHPVNHRSIYGLAVNLLGKTKLFIKKRKTCKR